MEQKQKAQGTTREFSQRVYAMIQSIPEGYVMSYGQIALLCGRPKGARLAAAALRYSPPGTRNHRVVNSVGRTAPGWKEQVRLLKAEGVSFKPNGCVDMRRHRWQP